MRRFLAILSLAAVLPNATRGDGMSIADGGLYFEAGVQHPAIARGPVWFVCDSPRSIYPQIPDCDVPWREVTASE